MTDHETIFCILLFLLMMVVAACLIIGEVVCYYINKFLDVLSNYRANKYFKELESYHRDFN